jgi:hypothetical protein
VLLICRGLESQRADLKRSDGLLCTAPPIVAINDGSWLSRLPQRSPGRQSPLRLCCRSGPSDVAAEH